MALRRKKTPPKATTQDAPPAPPPQMSGPSFTTPVKPAKPKPKYSELVDGCIRPTPNVLTSGDGFQNAILGELRAIRRMLEARLNHDD